MMKVFYPEA